MHTIQRQKPLVKDINALRTHLAQYNLSIVPELADYRDDTLGIFLRDESDSIQGGLVAEFDWNWLYVDLLWLDKSLRGKGLGRQLMTTIEQVALNYDVPIHLQTTQFQALDFYQHLGYELYGTLPNRPQGYDYYYLRKTDIQPTDTHSDLTIEWNPAKGDMKSVANGLKAYCQQFAVTKSRRIGVFIRPEGGTNGDGQILGGLYGSVYWDWFDLRVFWVDESLRGQGCGKQLLTLTEAECRRLKCQHITLDTTDWQALDFYQSQGFTIFATLPDHPIGYTTHYLKKSLT